MIWDALKRIADYDLKPMPVGDIGFNNPIEYVFQTAYFLREFGILPRPGGLDAQDKLLVDDWDVYFHAYDAAREDFKERRDMLDELHRMTRGDSR